MIHIFQQTPLSPVTLTWGNVDECRSWTHRLESSDRASSGMGCLDANPCSINGNDSGSNRWVGTAITTIFQAIYVAGISPETPGSYLQSSSFPESWPLRS